MASVNSMDARAIFRKAVKGKNIITPEVIAYEVAGDYVVELSVGEAMGSGKMYGVTVVTIKTGERAIERDKCFYDRKEARTYINELSQL